MWALVASLLGMTVAALQDRKFELSEEERNKISTNYGDKFLEMLLDNTNEDASAMFEAAVSFAAEKLTADKDAIIENLRNDILKLSEEPEPKPRTTATPGVKAGIQFAINMASRHNSVVKQALESANPMDMARIEGESIDVGDLNTEFGSVMPPRAKLDLFVKNIYLGIPDAPLFTREQSNTDYKAAAALITEVSQAFTPFWTPKGSVDFTPVVIPYRRHKINVSLRPAEIIKSWLTYLYEQGKTQAEMPVSKFIIEQMILPKVQDDVTRLMLGKGSYVEPTSASKVDGGQATDAVHSMDGLETILVNDYKAANRKFNHFAGAQNPLLLSGQACLDYFKAFAMAVSKYFVDKPLIYCSEEVLIHYQAQDYAVNGKYTGLSVGNQVRFTGFSLQPIKAMYGSPVIFCTPKVNMVMLVDYASAANCINKIEENHYNVDIMGEYSLSVGFKVAEAVYAAVPEGYEPTDVVIGNYPNPGTDSNWERGEKSEDDSESEAITVSGAESLSLGAGSGSNTRTYATSNGSAVEAEVTSENANWLSVSAEGNKVTFTREAFAYDSDAASQTRSATVRVSAAEGEGYLDVTVEQEMASE